MEFKEWLIIEEDMLQTIMKQLPIFYKGGIPDVLMQNMVYHYLTQGVGQGAVQNLMKDSKQYEQYKQVYKNIIDAVTQNLASSWTIADSGAWVEWYRKGNHKGIKVNGQTSKRYCSINPNDGWKVLQALPSLARKLDSVKTDPQSDVIGFKIPSNVGVFFSHKDNIVIHFYDVNAASQIDQSVKSFFSEIGVQEMDRSSQGRTAFGKDVNGESDSDLAAKQIVRNLRANQATIEQDPNGAIKKVQYIINQVAQNASHR
jgi:hypothetical protein